MSTWEKEEPSTRALSINLNIFRWSSCFFRAAFKNDQQNCLRDHDFELIQEFYTKQIESRTGRKISTELQFELEMYCLGSVYMTVQWVLGYRKCTPEELAHALTESMPVRLREVFQKLGLI